MLAPLNLLDARGAIWVTERFVGIIARIRVLAVGIAKALAMELVVALFFYFVGWSCYWRRGRWFEAESPW